MSGDINLNEEADLLEKLAENNRFYIGLPNAEARWDILMFCIKMEAERNDLGWLSIYVCKSNMEKLVELTEGLSGDKIHRAIRGVARYMTDYHSKFSGKEYPALRDLAVAIACQRIDSVP